MFKKKNVSDRRGKLLQKTSKSVWTAPSRYKEGSHRKRFLVEELTLGDDRVKAKTALFSLMVTRKEKFGGASRNGLARSGGCWQGHISSLKTPKKEKGKRGKKALSTYEARIADLMKVEKLFTTLLQEKAEWLHQNRIEHGSSDQHKEDRLIRKGKSETNIQTRLTSVKPRRGSLPKIRRETEGRGGEKRLTCSEDETAMEAPWGY